MTGACPRVIEAISARLDGEAPGIADAVVDAHLARCDACRAFAGSAAALHGRMRVRPATPVPDRASAILAAVADAAAADAAAADADAAMAVEAAVAHVPAPAQARWRERPVRLAVLAAALGLVAGSVTALVSRSGTAPARLAGTSGALGDPTYPGATVLAAAVPKPNLWLTDTADQPYDVATATRATVTVVYFGYTHCPDVCPLTMALTARALEDMPAAERRKVTVVFVTTDPARDTPARIRTWLDAFDPAFVGLTGSPATLHLAERQVGMPLSYAETATVPGSGSYAVVHAGYSLIYSVDGLAHLEVEPTVAATTLATTLDRLVTAGYRPA